MKRAKLTFLSAMGIFGTIGLFVRLIPLPSATIAFYRSVIGCLFLLAITLIGRKKFNWQAIKQHLTILVISGVAIGTNWILLFESYRHTTVATATVCYYLAPLLLLIATAFLGEKLTKKRVICISVALIGLICIADPFTNGLPKANELKGIAFGIGAAVLYAFVMLMNKQLSAVPAYDKTILQLSSAAIIILPYLLLSGESLLPQMQTGPWILMLVVGIVHTGIAYTLYFGSFKNLSSQTIAVFCYLDPLLAILLSAVFLKEPMSPANIVGTILILGSALYSELPDK